MIGDGRLYCRYAANNEIVQKFELFEEYTMNTSKGHEGIHPKVILDVFCFE
jgi:hypothetical protein